MKRILLTQGKEAIVSDCDYAALVKMGPWYTQRKRKKYYAHNDRHGAMHHIVLKRATGYAPKQVDHHDGNGLNNTRQNLRVATHRQNQCNRGPNCRNSSGFKGVSYCLQTSQWKANIRVYDHLIFLGRFSTPQEAARRYNKAARKYFGVFAWLNRIEDRRKESQPVYQERRSGVKRRKPT